MMRSGVILAVLLAAGCAPYAQRPDLPALTGPSLPELPTAWQIAQSRLGSVEVGWIERLDDPTLTALVAEAQTNNRDLQSTLAGVEQARRSRARRARRCYRQSTTRRRRLKAASSPTAVATATAPDSRSAGSSTSGAGAREPQCGHVQRCVG